MIFIQVGFALKLPDAIKNKTGLNWLMILLRLRIGWIGLSRPRTGWSVESGTGSRKTCLAAPEGILTGLARAERSCMCLQIFNIILTNDIIKKIKKIQKAKNNNYKIYNKRAKKVKKNLII